MAANLAGSVALVTGASRGIGRGIAVGLGEAGATVYVTGRSGDAGSAPWGRTLAETAGLVTGAGGRGVAVLCDHRNDEEVAAIFARIAAEARPLSVLVNNATAIPQNLDEIFGAHPFWELPTATWDQLFDVGVRSHFVASQHAARVMIKRGGGLIVNISSGAAQAKVGVVPYAVGKAAVDRMTADMALELKDHSVAAVSIWPPPTTTDAMLDTRPGREAPPTWSDPVFTGRIVAALAADPAVMEKSGGAFKARDLASEYRIQDLSG